jgi:hypothetical protein
MNLSEIGRRILEALKDPILHIPVGLALFLSGINGVILGTLGKDDGVTISAIAEMFAGVVLGLTGLARHDADKNRYQP